MGTFLRYLLSLGMHIAWHKQGKRGSVPPLRMPIGKNKGKTVPLPQIQPWQIMAALWLAGRIWSLYGARFKQKLRTAKHPLAGHLHDLLPDTADAANSAPTAVTPALPARPAPQYHTQPLGGDPAGMNGGSPSSNLPAGSVLTGLRGTG